jgi:hypothetical protein
MNEQMHPDDLLFPAAFHNGFAYFFERSDRWSGTRFGGPSEATISGKEFGPKRLHHVATFGPRELPIGKFMSGLPLFYGFCFSGCAIAYRRESSSTVKLLELGPTDSTDDFPYTGYPELFPYIPLRLLRKTACDFREFSKLSCQPNWNVDPEKLIILVPPSPVLGVSLWGPSGDAECVQVVFQCDITNGTVAAFNQCG